MRSRRWQRAPWPSKRIDRVDAIDRHEINAANATEVTTTVDAIVRDRPTLPTQWQCFASAGMVLLLDGG
jgi:hypothetical protein